MTTVQQGVTQHAADLRLFTGKDASAAPWFKPERLTESGFSPEAYVADLRRFVPLETLGQELESYLGTIRAKLVEVINEDYNDFVSLTTSLVNVDGAVRRMAGPLQEVSQKLGSVHNSLQEQLATLQEGLRLRQETAADRALLGLMQDTAHTMTKVESLLSEVEALDEEEASASPEALDNRCRMLERLASEVSRLIFYAAKGKGREKPGWVYLVVDSLGFFEQDIGFIQSLEPRMRAAKEKLQFRLSAALKAALVGNQPAARNHCLLAYAAISDAHGGEQAFQDAIVRPLVAQVVEQHPSAGTRAAESFPQVLDWILRKAQEELAPLLESTLGSESGLQSFNFLGNSLLAEVDTTIAKNFSGATSPGVPSTFLANYKAAMGFLDGLEAFCSSTAALGAFRGSEAYTSFTKRWKLSIYFSTRFQEIAGALEGAISGGGPLHVEQTKDTQPRVLLAPSAALITCLERTLSPDVFLRPLADKFARLALQLLARYTSWLKLGAMPPEQQEGSPHTQPEASEETWGSNTPINLLTWGRADVDSIIAWLRSDFHPSYTNQLAFLQPEVKEAAISALEQSVEAMSCQAPPLAARMVAQLEVKCSAGLSQLRGITAMYRMSTRPSPTRPSHYVAGILGLLAEFLNADFAALLQPAAKKEIAEGVVAGVSERMRKMLSELLETLRKTESSLKRIRQNRTAEAAPAGGGPSDIEKISLQLFLDVQELGRQAAKFEVAVASLPAYQGLWQAAAPANKADSIQL